ncbi:secretory calcium-binding phosphoprotein 1 isoform X1 [Kryptolebias marmoratus]|uniref:secretory calcium-binding phosphoprotein 1 isoform X1 n=1 Tax=Kryptolebias marmoratus TaxID=37003 RepID=UPI0007F937E6|nr:secretory calcium-binding phosphoprotein 1 isoform X1 [Kryptolebias marmoratus]
MKAIIITFCLIGAALANPIFHDVLESSDLDSNSTESLSVSESEENNTSEIHSSEENISNQSSESESLESTSEDKTSEESDSQSDEDTGMDSMPETKDDSMGSEENVRKQNWMSVFHGVDKALSAEDNTSTEVNSQTKDLSHELTKKQPMTRKTVQSRTNQALLDATSDSTDTTSDSADSTDVSAASNSSESTSSESHESEEADTSSKSTEDSNGSDSAELEQVRSKDCMNGTQSCESDEYFLQSIGDDAHFAVDNLMAPEEDDGELRLRR